MKHVGIAVLGAGAFLLLLAGVRGLVRRRLESRFGPDLVGVTAVGFSLLLVAMGAATAWLTACLAVARGG